MTLRPKILVTSAAGRTGAAAVSELLHSRFPVRALVRRRDARSEALERAGAEVVVGDLFDFDDLRRALRGVQRAYHCPPFAPNLLHGTMLFALAAEEAKLEVVALMSGWNPHSAHPSIATREHWIANQLYRWMPSVDVVHVNPGLFAFTYLIGVASIVHLGLFAAPFGDGLNAPPSNEDIARVVAGVLADPTPHIGKSYRPTGPELLSPQDVAEVLSRVTERKVRYVPTSIDLFVKAARTLGLHDFEIAQMRHYSEELRRGAFAVGAPTDHVELVTGQQPESFERTARRYLADPSAIDARLSVGTKLGAVLTMLRTIVARVPNYDRWERERDVPVLKAPVLAHESAAWRATAEQEQLHLLPTASGRNSLNLETGLA